MADGTRIEENLVMGNADSGAKITVSTVIVLDNTFSQNGGDGLTLSDTGSPALAFDRVGANLADRNVGLGMNIQITAPPYVLPDLLPFRRGRQRGKSQW